jgi:hypothetical protein
LIRQGGMRLFSRYNQRAETSYSSSGNLSRISRDAS